MVNEDIGWAPSRCDMGTAKNKWVTGVMTPAKVELLLVTGRGPHLNTSPGSPSRLFLLNGLSRKKHCLTVSNRQFQGTIHKNGYLHIQGIFYCIRNVGPVFVDFGASNKPKWWDKLLQD